MAIQESLIQKRVELTQNQFLQNFREILEDIFRQKQKQLELIAKECFEPLTKQQGTLNETDSWLSDLGGKYPNWKQNCQNPYIKSIRINRKSNRTQFETCSNENESCLQFSHLAVPMYVHLIQNYQKEIIFSLDPDPSQKLTGEKTMPQKMIKNFYIDNEKGRKIVGDTKFGDIIFQADFMMKQLMLGVDQLGNQFIYPQLLEPLFKKDFALSSQRKLNRFFLKVKDGCHLIDQIQTVDATEFRLRNPIIQVQAREMQIINGVMKDKEVQDRKCQCYQRAKIFSQNYDLISNIYPIFKILKGCMLGIAVSKVIKQKIKNLSEREKKIINLAYRQQKMPDVTQKIPTIFGVRLNQNLIISGSEIENSSGPQIKFQIETVYHTVSGGVNCSIKSSDLNIRPSKNIDMQSFSAGLGIYQNTRNSKNIFNQSILATIKEGSQYAKWSLYQKAASQFVKHVEKGGYGKYVQKLKPLLLSTALSTTLNNKIRNEVAFFSIKTATKVCQLAVKNGVKLLPFVPAAMGLIQFCKRLYAGQHTKAALQLMSGVAACVPGVGTGASLMIDGYLLQDDIRQSIRNQD